LIFSWLIKFRDLFLFSLLLIGRILGELTLAVIDSLYPKDLAKNYQSGDLRGLWKIEFMAANNE